MLHCLNSSTTRRARSGFKYSALPCRGAEERNIDHLRQKVLANKSLGRDLNKFTGSLIPRYVEIMGLLMSLGADANEQNITPYNFS